MNFPCYNHISRNLTSNIFRKPEPVMFLKKHNPCAKVYNDFEEVYRLEDINLNTFRKSTKICTTTDYEKLDDLPVCHSSIFSHAKRVLHVLLASFLFKKSFVIFKKSLTEQESWLNNALSSPWSLPIISFLHKISYCRSSHNYFTSAQIQLLIECSTLTLHRDLYLI